MPKLPILNNFSTFTYKSIFSLFKGKPSHITIRSIIRFPINSVKHTALMIRLKYYSKTSGRTITTTPNITNKIPPDLVVFK